MLGVIVFTSSCVGVPKFIDAEEPTRETAISAAVRSDATDWHLARIDKNYNIRKSESPGTAAAATSSNPPEDPHAKAKEQARAVAMEWLADLDNGAYAECWETAAVYFQKAVTKGRWVEIVGGVRDPLGKVISREFVSANYTHTLPVSPDGTYVVLQYRVQLEKKKNSIETITPKVDDDGQWRVSGYYLK